MCVCVCVCARVFFFFMVFPTVGNNGKKNIYNENEKKKKKVVQKLEILYCPICIVREGLYRDMALEREELYCKI